MLCAKGAVALQTKSLVVEEAANELINMLCPVDFGEEDERIEMEEDEGRFMMAMVVSCPLIYNNHLSIYQQKAKYFCVFVDMADFLFNIEIALLFDLLLKKLTYIIKDKINGY